MGKKWEDFEVKATSFLQEKYGEFADFIHLGGSDFKHSDIYVRPKTGHDFYIEVKHCPAQSGQFVVSPNEDSFEFSLKNFSVVNDEVKKILSFMNENYEDFKSVRTQNKSLDFKGAKKVFESWAINFYKAKRVKFFISNNFLIFPLESFKRYFDISAMYRIKKSGSATAGKRLAEPLKKHIRNEFEIDEFIKDGTKLFVSTAKNLENLKFALENTEFMFSKRGELYELRKLSKTFNANVIFTVTLKTAVQKKSDIKAFEGALWGAF